MLGKDPLWFAQIFSGSLFYVAQVGAEILALNGINTERGRVGDAKVDGNRNETQEL